MGATATELIGFLEAFIRENHYIQFITLFSQVGRCKRSGLNAVGRAVYEICSLVKSLDKLSKSMGGKTRSGGSTGTTTSSNNINVSRHHSIGERRLLCQIQNQEHNFCFRSTFSAPSSFFFKSTGTLLHVESVRLEVHDIALDPDALPFCV